MKALIYLVAGVAFVLGCISVFWSLAADITFDEQVAYVKSWFGESVEDSAASNVSESASKLGKVLKNNFEEAQDVYENGAKYNN
jgi:hypothetical protein